MRVHLRESALMPGQTKQSVGGAVHLECWGERGYEVIRKQHGESLLEPADMQLQ